MALETLKGVKEIGGFGVREYYKDQIIKEKDQFVEVDHRFNSLHFQLQNGPIKEVGVNGCRVDTLIHAAWLIIGMLNGKYHSDYNVEALNHLGLAIQALDARTRDREISGVEGTSKA